MSDANFEAAAPHQGYSQNPAEALPPVSPKQSTNVYTVMLVVSFICLVIGTIVLFLEFRKFGSWKTDEARPNQAALSVDDDLTHYLA